MSDTDIVAFSITTCPDSSTANQALQIIEFAAVLLDRTGLYEKQKFSTICRNKRLPVMEQEHYNGISANMLKGAPKFTEVSPMIYNILNAKVWLDHSTIESEEVCLLEDLFRFAGAEAPQPAALLDMVPLTNHIHTPKGRRGSKGSMIATPPGSPKRQLSPKPMTPSVNIREKFAEFGLGDLKGKRAAKRAKFYVKLFKRAYTSLAVKQMPMRPRSSSNLKPIRISRKASTPKIAKLETVKATILPRRSYSTVVSSSDQSSDSDAGIHRRSKPIKVQSSPEVDLHDSHKPVPADDLRRKSIGEEDIFIPVQLSSGGPEEAKAEQSAKEQPEPECPVLGSKDDRALTSPAFNELKGGESSSSSRWSDMEEELIPNYIVSVIEAAMKENADIWVQQGDFRGETLRIKPQKWESKDNLRLCGLEIHGRQKNQKVWNVQSFCEVSLHAPAAEDIKQTSNNKEKNQRKNLSKSAGPTVSYKQGKGNNRNRARSKSKAKSKESNPDKYTPPHSRTRTLSQSNNQGGGRNGSKNTQGSGHKNSANGQKNGQQKNGQKNGQQQNGQKKNGPKNGQQKNRQKGKNNNTPKSKKGKTKNLPKQAQPRKPTKNN